LFDRYKDAAARFGCTEYALVRLLSKLTAIVIVASTASKILVSIDRSAGFEAFILTA
jgi:hypothetical protein